MNLRYRDAITEFQKALKLDPQNSLTKLSLAQSMLEAGDTASALPLLQDYTCQHPQDYPGYYALGRAYRMLGDYAKSLGPLRRAAELQPKDYDAHYSLGLALAHSGQLDEAAQELKIAENLNPNAPEAPYQLSFVSQERRTGPGRERDAGLYRGTGPGQTR